MILFSELVFGPIKSRRFGNSLGINLLPRDYKVCNFNCVYCECGFTQHVGAKIVYPKLQEIEKELNDYLKKVKRGDAVAPDALTFAGNGEPLLNPDFENISLMVKAFRDKHFPSASLVLLSNGYMLSRSQVFKSTFLFDQRVFKLDAGSNIKFHLIDQPEKNITINEQTELLSKFQGKCTVQTMFVSGENDGLSVDNTGDAEIEEWLSRLQRINPEAIMIYTLDRDTPAKGLKRVSPEILEAIVKKVKAKGFVVAAY
jgi:wyosine [tRNA(Phe)-imidazoG37] synthetase (radical SAM superfamily)